jgi:murein DD-endopeptidase MepM/ murein hydrolase activator NlpD
MLNRSNFFPNLKSVTTNTLNVTPTPARVPEVVDFRMIDLEKGWIRYPEKAMMTEDSGASWQEVALSSISSVPAPTPTSTTTMAGEKSSATPNVTERVLSSITYGGKDYSVKQTQFVSDQVGWVLLGNAKEFKLPLFVTTDGGVTWNAEATTEVREAIRLEKARLERIALESAMYASFDQASKVMSVRSGVLLPVTASPGDVVLYRQNKPGDIKWQGKTYTLQPFGEGYFTYIPISIDVRPGVYPVGDQQLTIKSKRFETQYLQVTQEMESMRQDYQRIEADQRKINLARSKSAPTFLFTGPFIQPVEGILTTPYGHTRYVNGKYDSSHLAIDVAAKEGTPIYATNDGVVVLAETLYLTGNAIYIDHGMGLFSQHAHLFKLMVNVGDRVKKGDLIGLVGSTGFSTGPHLHFAFWVHNIQANPNLFFNTSPFRWLEVAP